MAGGIVQSAKDYQSETCRVAWLSSLAPSEAEALIGKTVARVEASEYGLKLVFSDGSSVSATGHTFGDSALGVDVSG